MLLRWFSKLPAFKTSIYSTKPDIPPKITNESFQIQAVRPTTKCTRSAVLALKQGMTAMWDKWGVRHALTILQVDRCQVVQIKSSADFHYLQLGVGQRSLERVTKPLIGHYLKSDVPPKKALVECRVSKDCILPLGYELMAQHFLPGQNVDVKGLSKGKGFQGGIKRWNFNRQTTTHGNSVSTRAIGSTGQRQDPGRTFPGKKMPGQLGNTNSTTQMLKVYKIDAKRNLLYIKGSVPGGWGAVIRVSDSVKDLSRQYRKLPHPTYLNDQDRPEIEVMEAPDKDTIEESYLHDNAFPQIKDDDPI